MTQWTYNDQIAPAHDKLLGVTWLGIQFLPILSSKPENIFSNR